jgi:muramoyltetrapeptide carboxypeptidase
MLKPLKLNTGDRVHVVAPASPVKPELFEKGISFLKEFGFQPSHGNIFRKWRYLAGKDSEREEELIWALQYPYSKAIFFARGGYGSLRLLPAVSKLQEFPSPKILLGCSDITSLHLFFQRAHEWVVFHGPMPSGDMARGQFHRPSFEKALMQTEPYELGPNVETIQGGDAEGVLLGGCLTLLDNAMGAAWEPVWTDAILFLEDVATKPYQIDRMLTRLKITGKLNDVKAFIFGEMKDCVQVENQGYTLQEVILDVLGPLQKPIYYGFPSGHVSGLNWTIPLGVKARVSSKPDFRLEILEGAVQ